MCELIDSIKARDPAQPSTLDVALTYAGFHVLGFYKVAHILWGMKWRTLARVVAHLGRMLTGIEIHPAATIGKNLFIDHGMGVVIGQTTVIGDDVLIYHGVTLGGKGGESKDAKRHPSVGNGAIIGAGAHVLGNITIGARAKVGAGAVVTFHVPDDAVVVGNPARLVACKECRGDYGLPDTDTPATDIPDSVMQDIARLREELAKISKDH